MCQFCCIMPRYTFSRTHPDSEEKLWIHKYTEIDLVLFRQHNIYGIEIHITSTDGCKTNVRVVMSGSKSRDVDELRYRESENLPDDVVQESVQQQEKQHSQGESPEDHIPFHQRSWEDLPANEYSRRYSWKTQVSKSVSRLERHEHSQERGTDGAIHWKFICPKLIIRFQRDGGVSFTDRDWLNFIWQGSNKTRFQYCQNSHNRIMYFRAIQGHTGGEMISPEMLGHVLIPHNWKEFVFHRGSSFNLTSVLKARLIAGG